MTLAQVTERRAGKPHFVATGGRMPTPPSWATRFVRLYREETALKELFSESPRPICILDYYAWDFINDNSDIIAVRWLP